MPAFTNAKPHIPLVFREIMKNHDQRMAIHALGANMTQADWRQLGILQQDKKRNLIPSAEKMLRWNVDKGDRP